MSPGSLLSLQRILLHPASANHHLQYHIQLPKSGGKKKHNLKQGKEDILTVRKILSSITWPVTYFMPKNRTLSTPHSVPSF